MSHLKQRENEFILPPLFVLLGPSVAWRVPTHTGEGVYAFKCSSLLETPSWTHPAMWASLSLVKLTPKSNHHNRKLVSAEPRRRDRCGFLGLDLQRGGQCPRSYHPQVVRQGSDKWDPKEKVNVLRPELWGQPSFPTQVTCHFWEPVGFSYHLAHSLSCPAGLGTPGKQESYLVWLICPRQHGTQNLTYSGFSINSI